MAGTDSSDIRANAETKGRRLKSLRNLADLSRKAMTRKYQISASTIQAWEEGKAGLTLKGAERVVNALKKEGVFCTLEWLIHGTGQSPYLAEKIYLGAKETAAELLYSPVTAEKDIIANELNTFRSLNHDVLDMVIQDDGMHPFYQKDDLVAGKRYCNKDINLGIDRDCIVETKTGDVLCRRLRHSKQSGRYNLQCVHLDTTVDDPILYNIEILAIAPILWHRRLK